MAEPSKSSFSFGTPVTNGSSNVFGSTSQSSATVGPSLFGTSTATGGSSIFSNNNQAAGQSTNLFGAGSGQGGAQKPSTGFSFGQKPGGESGGGGSTLFGQAQSSAGQQPGISVPFQGLATPSKPVGPASTGTGPLSNPFGGGTTSASTSAATPAGKPTFSFSGLGSTTPANPPPSSQAPANNPFALNANNQQQGQQSLFPPSGAGTSASQQSTLSSTAPPQNAAGSGFGLFANQGNSQNKSSTQPPAPTGGSNFFGNLGGQTSAASSGGQTAPTSIFAKPSQSSAAETQKSPFSFPSLSQAPSQNPQTSQSSAPSLFNSNAPAKSSETSAPASSAPFTNLFGGLGKPNDAAKSTTPSTSAAPSLFSNLGKAQGTPASSAGTATTSGQAPTQTTSTSNFLGKPGPPATSFAPSQSNAAPTSSAAETKSSASTAAGGTLGQSTSGPPPSAQSRLKNKSMDEIITRWASDLAKYQKEFQKQAEKVATWDHLLVENSEKIQKLYGSTLEAERATAEVERQITAVENDQNELESWLDRYEERVDQMISNSGDSLHGPDLERERTYQLAEKLSIRLEEMGKDLGSMIEEINDASATLNKNTKPDDPLSQVVRVLNSHLTQLQQIDQGAAALQLKIAAAQKASQTLSPADSLNGPSSDAADSFYRSFMGRR